jgi:hypothetical protein
MAKRAGRGLARGGKGSKVKSLLGQTKAQASKGGAKK